jgi:hypothetical protein
MEAERAFGRIAEGVLVAAFRRFFDYAQGHATA